MIELTLKIRIEDPGDEILKGLTESSKCMADDDGFASSLPPGLPLSLEGRVRATKIKWMAKSPLVPMAFRPLPNEVEADFDGLIEIGED